MFRFVQQIPDDLASHEIAADRGDKGDGRGRLLLTGGGIGGGLDRRDGGVDDLDPPDAALFQFPAHDGGERAGMRFGNIGDGQPLRGQLIAGAHRADDGGAGFFALLDDGQLGADGIDGVEDVIVGGEIEIGGVFGEIERAPLKDGAGGVDGTDAHGCRLGFVHADRLPRGDELSVQIGHGDGIGIDEGDFSDTGTDQRLHGSSADAADPKQADMRPPQSLKPRLTDQPHRPGIHLIFHPSLTSQHPNLYKLGRDIIPHFFRFVKGARWEWGERRDAALEKKAEGRALRAKRLWMGWIGVAPVRVPRGRTGIL